jgi:hypothetical protein
VKSNHEPSGKSAASSGPISISSPEFKRSALAELKDWVKRGHCQLAEGNEVLWTPEELAAMTPEQRARCSPQK